jgi:hypothetical protein
MWFDNKFKDESFFLGNYFKYFLKFFRFFKNIVKGKTKSFTGFNDKIGLLVKNERIINF